MRPLPPSLGDLLRSLHLRVAGGTLEQIAEVMRELECHQHPAVALGLVPFTISTYPSISHWAAEKIHSVLRRMDEDGILWLAREGRHFNVENSQWCQAWADLRPADVHKLEMFADASVGTLGLGSMHASGYVRQACVDRLALRRGKLAFTFLLLRINDWVKPVRAAARLAILGRLLEAREGDVGRCRELLENLLLTDYIESWGRDDHRSIREAIDKTLMSAAFEQVMEEGFSSKRLALQGRVYQLALERSEDDLAPVLWRAMASRSGTNRCWAARQATKRLSGDKLLEIVELMRHDSLAVIRYEAVFALAAKLPPADPSVFTEFLLDSSADVRFLACYYLAQHKFDARSFYLNALKNPTEKNLAAIVAAIGEKGKPGDEVDVVPLLSHSDPRVRAAAVFTVGKLGRKRDMDWLFVALHDPHKLVVRAAAKQLNERIHIVDASVIKNWLMTEPRLSLQRQAMRLGARMERWEALELLLNAVHHPQRVLRRDVQIELERWSRNFVDWYTPPNPDRLARLLAAFAAARGIVPEDILHWIGHRLAVYQKR